MKISSLLACILVLQASAAFADRDGFSSSTQGRLTVLKAFSLTSNVEGYQLEDSLSLKPGTYEIQLGRGSYYKSTLCDLLPYCTKRWEDQASYFGSLTLLKKEDRSEHRKPVKSVKFATEAARGAGAEVLADVVIDQGIKILQRSNTNSQWVNSREATVECTIKDRCWDAYGYDCSYLAGTAPATIEDKITTTKTSAKIMSLANATLATYESTDVQKDEDVVTAQGACTPNRN